MSRKIQRFISFFALVLLTAFPIMAQVTTGSLQGVVKDPNGAVVAGATVRISNTETGQVRETQTNGEGYYRVTNLLPGDKYKVEISANGFSNQTLEGVGIRLATENNLDAQLSLQGATGVVTVTDTGEILQTTQNQLKTDFSQKQLTQLPINGGAIDSLALLVPGVLTPGDTDFTNGVGISANGNRGRSNNFQIDGQDNNDNSVSGPSLTLTNTEAIGEFQVITNNFSAEFGRNSGAQINSITKAGKNEISGNAFWYHNNSSLDALNNTQKVNNASFKFLSDNGFSDFKGLTNRKGVDPYRTNRGGFSVGGPIKKEKAFFFATYQGTFTSGESAVNGLASLQFIFDRESSLLARQLFPNPATAALVSTGLGGGPAFVQGQGQFFVAPPVIDANGDTIPDTFMWGPGNPYGFTPTANRLQPSSIVRDGNGNLRTLYLGEPVRIIKTDSTQNEFITREDFNLTEKDIISARYIFNKSNFPLATGRALAGSLFDVPSKNHNLGVTYTRFMTSNWTNEARFNFSYLDVKFGEPTAKTGPTIGLQGARDQFFNSSSLAFGPPTNLPQSRIVTTFQQQDTLSGTIGNHGLKFGFDFRQQESEDFFLPNFLGNYSFRGFNAAGSVPANTFYNADGTSREGGAIFAFENMLLNRPRDITFAIGDPNRNIKQKDFFFFVQDNWRAKSNLTLNLGLRYEISTQPLNGLIEDSNAREANVTTSIFGNTFPLETRTALKIGLDKNNFAPRVGFAWSPDFNFLGSRFSNGKTVLRGGFGVSYDPGFFNIVNNMVTAAPFAAVGFIRQNDPGVAGAVGVPFLPSTPAQLALTPATNGGDPRLFNQTRVADDFHNPYTMSFNFGIQQEVWKNAVLEIRYSGSRIRDQFQTVNANPDLRGLAAAGQYLFGDQTRFTGGRPVTIFTGTGAVAPTNGFTIGSFNTRGVDAAGGRINGSGRLDPNFASVRLRTNGANSDYDGLQTEFRTRFSNLSLNLNYTLSKTIDNASEIFSSLGGGQSVAVSQNPFDTDQGERALSAFHQKHNFTANFIYDLPFYKSQNGAVGKLLGGYQFSGIVRIGSGRPYTPITAIGNVDAAFENSFLGVGALRPFNGNPNAGLGTIAVGSAALVNFFGDIRTNPGQFIIFDTLKPGSNGVIVNSAAEAVQQARLIYNDFGLFTQGFVGSPAGLEAFEYFKTPYGNVGRNTFFGTNFYQVDLSISKTTRFSEKLGFEIRAEAQNLFNTRNFGVPNTFTESAYTSFNGVQGAVGTFNNPGANTGSSRTVRLGMKFIF